MLQDSPYAEQFIDALVAQKNPQGVDESVVEQLKKDLLASLENKVQRLLLNAMNETQLVQFEHLIDTKQVDKIPSYLEEIGVSMQAIIARAMSEVQANYLEA